MRKGKLLGIILMKALRIRTGKYDEESGIFPGFPTEETAVQNMISIMELHWRIWNPESSYDSEEKSFGQILPCFPPCRMPGNGGSGFGSGNISEAQGRENAPSFFAVRDFARS